MIIRPPQSAHNAVSATFFQDKKFVQWADLYINKMAWNASTRKNFKLVECVIRAAKVLSHPIFQLHWDEFYRYNFETCNTMSITAMQLNSFLKPLMHLFRTNPHCVGGAFVGKNNKSKKAIRKRQHRLRFQTWANQYLYRLYKEVILVSHMPEMVNLHLWRELQDAALRVNSPTFFQDLSLYDNIALHEICITHPHLADFVKPLRYIYQSSSASTRVIRTVNRVNANRKNKQPKSDLETCPAETIDVPIYPVELASKIDMTGFETGVLKVLTHLLKKGFKYISSHQLAKCFGVDQRDFEEWANKNPKLKCRQGREGILYYGLTPVKFPKGDTMTVAGDNLNAPAGSAASFTADAADALAKLPAIERQAAAANMADQSSNGRPGPPGYGENAGPGTLQEEEDQEEIPGDDPSPAIGTDDFDTLFTQLLSSGPVWRSIATVSAKVGHSPEVIMEWADGNAAVMRRPGKEDGVIYYSLMSRWGEEPEDKKDKADKKQQEQQKPVKESLPYTQKELLALGMLHRNCDDLVRIMNFYANGLATRHDEAFSHFTKAQKHLSSGVSLLQKGLKIKDNKLPELEGI